MLSIHEAKTFIRLTFLTIIVATGTGCRKTPPPPVISPTPEDLVLENNVFRYRGHALLLLGPFDDWVAALGPPSPEEVEKPLKGDEDNRRWHPPPEPRLPPSSFRWDDLGIGVVTKRSADGVRVVDKLTVYLRSVDDPTMPELEVERRLELHTPKNAFPKRFFMEGAILEPGRQQEGQKVQLALRDDVFFDRGRIGNWFDRSMTVRAPSPSNTGIVGHAEVSCALPTLRHKGPHVLVFDEITFAPYGRDAP
jgi:hypothetical protein